MLIIVIYHLPIQLAVTKIKVNNSSTIKNMGGEKVLKWVELNKRKKYNYVYTGTKRKT